jgi:hypothetical protein
MDFFQNTHLKPNTAKTYNTHLNTWISLLPSNQANLAFVYTHPNYSVVTLRKHLKTKNQDNPRTVNTYMKPVMTAIGANPTILMNINKELLQKCENRWKEMRQITFEKAYAYRLAQKPSPGQALKSGSLLKLADLIQARDVLPDGSINKLLIGFYTHLPPVRADYYATQILPFGSTPTSPNYIFHDSEHSHLVINDFKTNTLYKSITNELPPELHRQLVLSLQMQPRSYLFINKHGNPFTRNGFTQWAMTRLFEITRKGLTITMLRHIYISSLDLNSSPAYLQEISRKMGHAITQQMLYKWKDSD